MQLHHNDSAHHGYTIAANIGLRASTAELVVLLNSDTVVTRGWLDALVDVALSADDIGVIGPLSNAAGHQSVPLKREGGDWAINALPAWADENAVALVIDNLAGDAAIDGFLAASCGCRRASGSRRDRRSAGQMTPRAR